MPKPKVASIVWTDRSLQNSISIKEYLENNYSAKEIENFYSLSDIIGELTLSEIICHPTNIELIARN